MYYYIEGDAVAVDWIQWIVTRARGVWNRPFSAT
jgi:hypothetical protein